MIDEIFFRVHANAASRLSYVGAPPRNNWAITLLRTTI